MGLEGAEIVMEVEDVFDISIDEDEQVLDADGTAGDLYRFVLGKLREKGMLQEPGVAARCLSSVAFYVFRRGLVEEFGLERKSVRPSSRMSDLVPLEGRRRRWRALEKRLDLKLPAFVRSSAVKPAISLGAVAILVTGFFSWPWLHVAAWSGVAFIVTALVATIPLARHFPPSCTTVRGVVLEIMRRNLKGFAARRSDRETRPKLQPDEVWVMLRTAICEVLDVSSDQVTKGTKFVKDLGVG